MIPEIHRKAGLLILFLCTSSVHCSGAVASTNLPAPILSFEAVGGGVWEVTIAGKAGAVYEFHSAPDITFTNSTLVSTLTQADPPNDAGTITGGNLLTTDGAGSGKVQMTLGGDSAEFVRAKTTTP